MQLIPAILRGFQTISAIIVLGISVNLARGQNPRADDSSVPPATGYAAFCGGFGVLVALIGVASLFASFLEGVVMWALDGLSGVTMLASGIAYAVLLKDTSCGNYATTWDHRLLSGGCQQRDGTKYCNFDAHESKSRCVSAKADNAFMFISFVACVAIVGFSVLRRRGGGGGGKAGVNYA
ncbi:marvel domain-containing protein [Aspergillus egyptiacus]|nr:marvel domain-containing protein [Aspergillus egyptiacus]